MTTLESQLRFVVFILFLAVAAGAPESWTVTRTAFWACGWGGFALMVAWPCMEIGIKNKLSNGGIADGR